MTSMKAEMQKIYGKDGMRRPPSRDELYDAVEIITETFKAHKARLDAIEGEKAAKPRVRVQAGSRAAP